MPGPEKTRIDLEYVVGRIQNVEETLCSAFAEMARQVASNEDEFIELKRAVMTGFKVKEELCRQAMVRAEISTDQSFFRGKRDGAAFLAEQMSSRQYHPEFPFGRASERWRQ